MQAHGMHDHRQFGLTKRRCSGSALARGSASVRRAGGVRSPRLAGVGLPGRAFAAMCSSSPAISTGSTEFYSDQVDASAFLPVAEMERASCSDSCPWAVLAVEGGLSLRLQHAECRSGGGACRPRASASSLAPRRALEGRGRAPGAHPGSTPWRKQPRSHAPHLRERAGHLWLLFGRPARHPPQRICLAATCSRRRLRRSAAAARALGSSVTLPPSP